MKTRVRWMRTPVREAKTGVRPVKTGVRKVKTRVSLIKTRVFGAMGHFLDDFEGLVIHWLVLWGVVTNYTQLVSLVGFSLPYFHLYFCFFDHQLLQ